MHTRNRSNVMLAELVVVVLFFSLIAVIITQMFVATAQKGKLDQRTQIALVYAQDTAEILTQRRNADAMLETEGFSQASPGVFEKLTGDGAYRVRVALQEAQASSAGTLLEGKITVVDENHPLPQEEGDQQRILVELPVASYVPVEEVAQ